MRGPMDSHAHGTVKLIRQFGIGVTMSQRKSRNRQKAQRRKENQSLAGESIEDAIHAQSPYLAALTDTGCVIR